MSERSLSRSQYGMYRKRLVNGVRYNLPEGRGLPDETWQRRQHR
jgi:hypothetical protein